MAARRRKRFRLLVLLAVVLVAAGGWTAYWYVVAGEVRAGLAVWTAERRAAGWTVDLGTPAIGGYPFRTTLRFDAVRLAGPGTPPHWSWQAPALRATARPWRLRQVSVSAPGVHRLGTPDGAAEIAARTIEADLVAAPAGVRTAVLRLADATLRLPRGDELSATAVVAHLGREAELGGGNRMPGTTLAFDAQGIALPAAWRPVFGVKIGKFAVDAVVAGRLDLRQPLPAALAAWRDAGGVLDVSALALDWERLQVRGEGTFALDRALQPEGAMTAEIGGLGGTVDRLVAAGMIDPRAAFAARVANRALGGGDDGPVRLPLTIQERRLYVGPVPLLRLRAVRWE